MFKKRSSVAISLKLGVALVLGAMATSFTSVAQAQGGTASTWAVSSGENLWKISSNSRVFSRGDLWPLIYKANSGIINDPDLIRPGQLLTIPRGVVQSEVAAASRHARTRGEWVLGEIEFIDQAYLNE